MSQSAAGMPRVEKWYSKNVFPLIPVLEKSKADQYNSRNFSFRWLFFTAWTLDHVEFELAFVISTHWGIGFIGLLPYLRWVFAIPCPEKLSIWINDKLNRNE